LLDFCLCLFLSNKFNKFLALLTVKWIIKILIIPFF
jgi:hypothetical protein